MPNNLLLGWEKIVVDQPTEPTGMRNEERGTAVFGCR
ncbi:hypothetical protein LINGRAHAP2_LOCUS1849 [Linum grandiflorum]